MPIYAEENGWGYYTYETQTMIAGYYGNEKKITVPNTLAGREVTSIWGLIAYNETVEEITIPDYITDVRPDWFHNASNLKTIRLSASAKISGNTFQLEGCKNMESFVVDSKNSSLYSKDGVLFNVDGTRLINYPSAKAGNYVIPDTVQYISDYAFENTSKLRDVTIPAGASFSINSFIWCDGITNYFIEGNHSDYCSENGIIFDKSKSMIVEFPSGRTGSYTVPSSVNTIKNNAFAYSKLSEIILNDELTSIGTGAFFSCANIKEIDIPLGVISINSGLFVDCVSLKNIYIHKNIEEIESSAFMGCDSLININVDKDNARYSEVDGMLCNKNKTQLLRFPSGRAGEYTIPDTLSVNDETFRGANKLKVINVPEHIEFFDIYDCESLEAINVSPQNQYYSSVDGVLYNKDKTTLCIVPTMKSGTFTVPSSVTTIDDYAFYDCENLEFIVMPNTITKIVEFDENENSGGPLWGRPNIDTILMIEKGSIADRYIEYVEFLSVLLSGIKVNYKYCYGHSYEAKVTTEPTCTKKGVKTYTCKHNTCKHTYTEEIPTKKHTNKTTTTKATFKANGSIVTKCTTCGTVGNSKVVYFPKTINLSKTKYTHNGKVVTPSVIVKDSKGNALKAGTDYSVTYAKGRKNTGRYTVTIKFKGNYSGTVKKTFDIVPEKVNIKKTTAKKKAFVVTWKKQDKQVTGYEIKYSTSKKFTKKTTKTKVITSRNKVSFTTNKLKAKKAYYVKLRTYKTIKVNGKKVKLYSAWSSAKKVITKK